MRQKKLKKKKLKGEKTSKEIVHRINIALAMKKEIEI